MGLVKESKFLFTFGPKKPKIFFVLILDRKEGFLDDKKLYHILYP